MKKNRPQFFTISETSRVNLAGDFKNLVGTFSDNGMQINALTDLVFSKYSEKHRCYHNLSHVKALLLAAGNFKEKFVDYESVRLAIWFHDVIYEPKRHDNEIKSAELAVEKLKELSVPEAVVRKVEKTILATQKHEAAGLDSDGELFLDLDLGILGAQKDVYQNYQLAIRREYSFVPWFLYRSARAKILKSFLKREFIYFTGEMREKFETAARRNIANEIKELS